MKKTNPTRPRVTKVKVIVKSNVAGGYTGSEIVFTVDARANASNFPDKPKIRLDQNTVYQTTGDAAYDDTDDIFTVTFSDTSNIYNLMGGVDVEGTGTFKDIPLEFQHR